MKIYLKQNVFEAALDRIRFVFDEFENVVVNFSGGKDSTVCFNLALMVAREKNRLPLSVMFIDQEVEWQGTVDFVTSIMERRDVQPLWFQMPMVITNNASSFSRYNYCWKPEDEAIWAHPKHPLSIKENRYGTDRFHKLFGAIMKVEYGGRRAAYISGVRAEETPKRYVSLTNAASYKDITWGNVHNEKYGHYSFYPLYDWSYTDVWKAIHDNGWQYNRVYDAMYSHGIGITDMRISNLHHETAIQVLLLVQEIEPETWDRVADRVAGANTISHLSRNAFACPAELPSMFESWTEYAQYLIDHIIQEKENRDALQKRFDEGVKVYTNDLVLSVFCREVINTVLSSDWDWTKLTNFHMRQNTYNYRKWKRGILSLDMLKYPQFLPAEAIAQIKGLPA